MEDINTIYETAIAAIYTAETIGEKMDIQNDALDTLCAIGITSENQDALRDAVYRLDTTDVQGDCCDGINQSSGMDAYEDAGDIAHEEYMED